MKGYEGLPILKTPPDSKVCTFADDAKRQKSELFKPAFKNEREAMIFGISVWIYVVVAVGAFFLSLGWAAAKRIFER